MELLPVRAATAATGADTDERRRNASLIVPVDEDNAVAGLTQQEAGGDASKKDSLGQEENKQTSQEESLSKCQEDHSDDKSGGGSKRFVSHTHGVCIVTGTIDEGTFTRNISTILRMLVWAVMY